MRRISIQSADAIALKTVTPCVVSGQRKAMHPRAADFRVPFADTRDQARAPHQRQREIAKPPTMVTISRSNPSGRSAASIEAMLELPAARRWYDPPAA